jgi:RNA polymerase sigma-70 factor (ECF subfamily)
VLLRAVYEQHGRAVTGYARRLLNGDHAAAADITQETFLRAWRNPQILAAGQAALRGWLLVVARNLVIDRIRAVRARPTEIPAAFDLDAEQGHAAPDHADRVAAAVVVSDAIAGLSDAHREVLQQLYFQDRSLADTAAGMGISVGTVKSRAHYAICALRKALALGEGR